MKNLPLILCAGALLLTLGGCHAQSGVQSVQSADGNQSSSLDSSVNPYQSQGAQADISEIQPEEKSSQGEGAQMVTLYIGMDDQFQQYQEPYEGTLNEQGMVPAEGVVAEMAQLTGWNLDLADEITSGPGGMTVSFADTCSIFTGPPDPQKEEFHVYDAGELAATILDSIQHTLQYNFVDPEKGEPSSLDIYYCDAAGESSTIPGLDVTIPMDTPYSGLAMA